MNQSANKQNILSAQTFQSPPTVKIPPPVFKDFIVGDKTQDNAIAMVEKKIVDFPSDGKKKK